MAWASYGAPTIDVAVPASVRARGFEHGRLDETRLLPGLIALVRQHIRAVVEGELFTQHAATRELGRRKPHALWLRLDIAF